MARIRTSEIKRTAFHEAAHAVVYAINQLPFVAVGIHRTRKEVKRYNRRGYLIDDHRTINIKQAATLCIACYASIPAERILNPDRTEFELSATACSNDWENAEVLGEDWGFDLEQALDAAYYIVRLSRQAIDAVAKALLEKGELTYEEVLMILRVLPHSLLSDCEFQIWKLTSSRASRQRATEGTSGGQLA